MIFEFGTRKRRANKGVKEKTEGALNTRASSMEEGRVGGDDARRCMEISTANIHEDG